MQVDGVLKPRYKKCTEKEKIKMIVLKIMGIPGIALQIN